MAKKAKITKPTGGHTPVSNLRTEAAQVVGKPSSTPPSEGVNPKTLRPREDGSEAVKSHGRTEAATAELFIAPEDKDLRDIGEASFGPPPPIAETVHGPDDRVKISNTAIYPWRAHASLLITAADNSMWIGTGWFIGPHTLFLIS